eukprot:ANDGO_07842.mRNA.1 hypothetical protein
MTMEAQLQRKSDMDLYGLFGYVGPHGVPSQENSPSQHGRDGKPFKAGVPPIQLWHASINVNVPYTAGRTAGDEQRRADDRKRFVTARGFVSASSPTTQKGIHSTSAYGYIPQGPLPDRRLFKTENSRPSSASAAARSFTAPKTVPVAFLSPKQAAVEEAARRQLAQHRQIVRSLHHNREFSYQSTAGKQARLFEPSVKPLSPSSHKPRLHGIRSLSTPANSRSLGVGAPTSAPPKKEWKVPSAAPQPINPAPFRSSDPLELQEQKSREWDHRLHADNLKWTTPYRFKSMRTAVTVKES